VDNFQSADVVEQPVIGEKRKVKLQAKCGDPKKRGRNNKRAAFSGSGNGRAGRRESIG
jgi:hypothetical protein